MEALSPGRIGHLIVVLDIGDELRGPQVQTRCAAPLLLPFVALALVEIPVLDGGYQLLRFAEVIRVICFIVSREGHPGAVMEIVVPQRINTVAALLDGPYHFSDL